MKKQSRDMLNIRDSRIQISSVRAVAVRTTGLPVGIYYWRERDQEVDFVFRFRKRVYGIEVKFGKKKSSSGLQVFLSKFKKAVPVFIERNNYEKFLSHTERFLLNRN